MTDKKINLLYLGVLTAFVVFSFQNCGETNFQFDTNNAKVGENGALGDRVEICTNPADCVQPSSSDDDMSDPSSNGSDNDSSGDSGDSSNQDPSSGTPTPSPTTGTGDSNNGQGGNSPKSPGSDPSSGCPDPDSVCDNQDKDSSDRDNGLPMVSCKDADKTSFTDAVLMVEGLALVGEKEEVVYKYQGPISLNGFEVAIPDQLKGQQLRAKIIAADSGHHFISKHGYKVAMTQITGQKSTQRSFRIDVTQNPDGSYLVSADWASRIHPGKNQCGLLPLEK